MDDLLVDAAEKGDCSTLERLLANKSCNLDYRCDKWVNQREQDQKKPRPTALMVALNNGHAESAKLLLDAGADATCKDDLRWTCMHHAAAGGSTACQELLISQKTDVNARSVWRRTALMFALSNGHLNSAEWLLNRGANVTDVDEVKRTCLHHAIHGGSSACVDLVLKHYPTDMEPNLIDGFNRTPLMLAIEKNNDSAVKALLQSADKDLGLTAESTNYHGKKDVIEDTGCTALNMILNRKNTQLLEPYFQHLNQRLIQNGQLFGNIAWTGVTESFFMDFTDFHSLSSSALALLAMILKIHFLCQDKLVTLSSILKERVKCQTVSLSEDIGLFSREASPFQYERILFLIQENILSVADLVNVALQLKEKHKVSLLHTVLAEVASRMPEMQEEVVKLGLDASAVGIQHLIYCEKTLMGAARGRLTLFLPMALNHLMRSGQHADQAMRFSIMAAFQEAAMEGNTEVLDAFFGNLGEDLCYWKDRKARTVSHFLVNSQDISDEYVIQKARDFPLRGLFREEDQGHITPLFYVFYHGRAGLLREYRGFWDEVNALGLPPLWLLVESNNIEAIEVMHDLGQLEAEDWLKKAPDSTTAAMICLHNKNQDVEELMRRALPSPMSLETIFQGARRRKGMWKSSLRFPLYNPGVEHLMHFFKYSPEDYLVRACIPKQDSKGVAAMSSEWPLKCKGLHNKDGDGWNCEMALRMISLAKDLCDYLGTKSSNFHLLKPEIHLIGSLAEGTRLGFPCEADFMLIFANLKPSYVMLGENANTLMVSEQGMPLLGSWVKADGKTLDYGRFLEELLQELQLGLCEVTMKEYLQELIFDLHFVQCPRCEEESSQFVATHCAGCFPAVTTTKLGPCLLMRWKYFTMSMDFIPVFEMGESVLSLFSALINTLVTQKALDGPNIFKSYMERDRVLPHIVESISKTPSQASWNSSALAAMKVQEFGEEPIFLLRPGQSLQIRNLEGNLKTLYIRIKLFTAICKQGGFTNQNRQKVELKSYHVKKLLLQPETIRLVESNLRLAWMQLMQGPLRPFFQAIWSLAEAGFAGYQVSGEEYYEHLLQNFADGKESDYNPWYGHFRAIQKK